MENKTLRIMLAFAAILLVVEHFARWLSAIWNTTAGGIGAVVVVGVSVVCGRLARSGTGNVGFFLVPTLLFTVIPAVAKVWNFFTAEKTLFDRFLEVTPFLLFFVVPLGLILSVWTELDKEEV